MPAKIDSLEMLKISRLGLKARAKPSDSFNLEDESHFLDILEDFVERSQSPADELISKFNLSEVKNFYSIYNEYSY